MDLTLTVSLPLFCARIPEHHHRREHLLPVSNLPARRKLSVPYTTDLQVQAPTAACDGCEAACRNPPAAVLLHPPPPTYHPMGINAESGIMSWRHPGHSPRLAHRTHQVPTD